MLICDAYVVSIRISLFHLNDTTLKTGTPRRLSMAKLNKIRDKLRAHAYVNTKGFNLHEEFKRFEKECRGHGEVSGQLSHEEFKHAIKRLCPVSDGDVVCLLRIFDNRKRVK